MNRLPIPLAPCSLALSALTLCACALLFAACDDAPPGDDDPRTPDATIAPDGDGDVTDREAGLADMDPDGDGGVPILDAEVFTDTGDPGGPDRGIPMLPEVCLMPPARPDPTPLDMEAACRAPGGPLRIRDLRDRRCPDAPDFADRNGDGFSDQRIDVVLPEAVVSAVFEDAFAVQDPEGLPWGGLWVFMNRAPIPAGVRPGARVRLSGSFFEFYTLSELTPDDEGGVQVIGDGDPPAPIVVAEPARLRGGDLAEPLEDMWLEIGSVSVVSTEPDCPQDFDMFLVTDALRVEDEVGLTWAPSRADFVRRLAGVLHYSFETWKLRPRGDADIEWVHCGGVPDKCEAAECAVEPGAPETRALIITEIMDDPRGPDADREWLELYNPGPGDHQLDGWRLEACNGTQTPLSGRISAGQRLVIAASRDREVNGGVDADLLLGDFTLSNEEGSVLVFDDLDQLVDQVRYSSEAPWPLRDSGQSLELNAPAADNSNGAAWQAGQRDYGAGGRGTPGR